MDEKKRSSKATPSLAVGLLLAALGWGLDGMAGYAPAFPVHAISLAMLAAGAALILYAALKGRLGTPKAVGAALLWILLAAAAGLLWSPPVRLDVLMAPQPFSSAGRQHLAYEIRLRHYGWRPIQVQEVRVLDGQQRERGRFDADFLGRGPIGETPSEALLLPAGGELILYLWLDLDPEQPMPAQLSHQILWNPPAGVDQPGWLHGAHTFVDQESIPAIGPPLADGPWMAQAGPSNWSPHRRSRLLGYLAQRFAIDWVRVDDQGRSWVGDEHDNKSYYAYGTPALAVADATVVEVTEGFPENRPPERLLPLSLTSFAGNSVMLRLGKGLCAFYAHLQPGSLRVSVGQTVRRGEVLGLVGNSGNSSEPHLHFHLSSGCSPLRSEGVPYVYEEYFSHGYFPYGQSFQLPLGQARRRQLPLQSELVTFPASRPAD